MEKYNVRGYPTTLVLKPNGEEVDRIVGFGGKREAFVQRLMDYANGENTLESLLEVLKSSDADVETQFAVAQKFNLRGNIEQAAHHYKKVIDMDPENNAGHLMEAKYNLAVFDIRKNKNFQSLEKFLKNTTDEIYLKRGYSKLAREYSRLNRTDDAVNAFEQLLRHFPGDASMMNSFAWFIFKQELKPYYKRGIEVARSAVQIAPDNDAIWDTLGQLLFAAGETDKAIEAMSKATELAPDESSYKENLEKYKKARNGA